MKKRIVVFCIFFCLTFLMVSCQENEYSQTQQTIQPSPAVSQQEIASPLFSPVEMALSNPKQNGPEIVRERLVNINLDLLLKANGRPRELDGQLNINLYPDVNYVGVIETVEENGPENYAWIGNLENIEYSSMFIIYVEGVFIAHFASPAGIYEVQFVEDDVYQIVQIDQTKLPQDN